jgi:pyridoxine 5-phosphate synthase
VKSVVRKLTRAGIRVSLFIDPEGDQIEAAAKSGAGFIELHTGAYADARTERARERRLRDLVKGAALARDLGLRVHAGHGLNYQNVGPVAQIEGMEELNIGHSIIARAVFTGLTQAVREMKDLINRAQCGLHHATDVHVDHCGRRCH